MAQYFVDFSADTVGQPPAGWTLNGFGAGEFSVVDDATARGGKSVSLYATSDARRFASYDAAGMAENVEMLVRFRCADADYVYPVMLRQQGSDLAAMSAYFVQMQGDVATLRRYLNGTAGNITSIATPVENTSDWAYMRFRVNGTRLQVKVWAVGVAEPATWNVDVTNTTISGAGLLGVFAYYGWRQLYIDSIGFATAGETAPDAAVSAGGGMAGISVNVGGAAKAVVAAYANVGGVAKLVTAAYANVGGLPKQIF